MTQNIYDNPEFHEGYSQLDRSVHGLAGAAEWPAIRPLLPELAGKRVVDLGCGFGWFCRFAHEQGAAQVLGVDVSEKMLARARAMSPGAIDYRRADLATLVLPESSCDFAWSSLALHYLEHLAPVFARVHRALVPGGEFVFSMEHPVYMAVEHAECCECRPGLN
ncbi:SAM-dependent methyltransferase [Opitutaceae bacterium TAV5]|nr:SAM-dependent methyltransferase [Opitutaceae bacterium TAV5]